MKKILFPTQFSSQARGRLISACKLAHDQGAQVIVLAIIPVPDLYRYPTPSLLSYALDEAEEAHVKAFGQLRSSLPEALLSNIQLRLEIITGNPAESILLAAEKHQPNVILIGGESYARMNAVTEKLIKKAACPVLALSPDVQIEASPTLVYATNFRKEDQRVVNKLLTFAKDFGGKLLCIHIKQDEAKIDYSKVLPWQQTYKKEIETGLISFEIVYQHEVHQQLDAKWRKHQPGLWVMPVAPRNWWQNWFPSSSLSLDVSPLNSPILALRKN